MGHAQAMASQAVGFLVIDRLALDPIAAQQSIGMVLMTGAGAALLVQWGLIPLLDMRPRMLLIVGLSLSAMGCALVGVANTLIGLSTAFALASAGFGFARPGYTAGSSLAVGNDLQSSVAGKVTSVNGAAYVFGPSIGVALYQVARPLPYLVSAVLCAGLAVYAAVRLRAPAADAKKGPVPEGAGPESLGEDA